MDLVKLTAEAVKPGPAILGFAGPLFRLDGGRSVAAALLTQDAAMPWEPPPLAGLTLASLGPALAAPAPEFILLGTGTRLIPPPSTLTAALEASGIGIEAMDSRAAARAWGVLRGEGRRIAAALYPLAA